MIVYGIFHKKGKEPIAWRALDGDAQDASKQLLMPTKGKRSKRWKIDTRTLEIWRYTSPGTFVNRDLVDVLNGSDGWWINRVHYADVFTDPNADLEAENPPDIIVKVKI